jgi:cytoskeletal protein CcmA (bactofilin family)
MAEVTVIGRGARVRGRVSLSGGRGARDASGSADLEVQGYFEGEAVLDGEITVEASGLVAANLSARRIVVRGAVRGDLTADEAIVLEEGARVVGDLRAPRLSIAAGASVRGDVQAGDVEPPKTRAKQQESRSPQRVATAPAQVAARPPAPQPVATRAAPPPLPKAAPPPMMTRAAPPPSPSAQPSRSIEERALVTREAAPAVERAATSEIDDAPVPTRSGNPPAPVVPALKKGARGALISSTKKRA